MQQLHKRISLALATAFGIAALAAAPVWAEHGGTTVHADTATGTSGSTSHSETTTQVATTSDTETETTTDGSTDTTTLRQEAQEMLQTKRQNVKEHTAEQKQKACEAHAKEINKRATNYAAAAQRHLDVFNAIFTKVQAFQTNKQLNVTGYDALVATATAKQAAAQTAVDNLKALDVSIDCTQTDPASTVATLKTTTAATRSALQDYRKSIKDIVVALKGASTAQTDKSTSTDSSTDTSATGGTQ